MKRSLGAKTLLFPTPVLLVGTYDRAGKANLMVAAWGGICCSQPPCVAVSLRKATHSHGCIVERKAFTVGIASEGTLVEADYCGIASGRDVDKFAATGWTAVRSDLVDAPYAAQAPVVLECRLLQTIEIGLHTQFIGEIVDVKGDPAVCGEDGQLDIEKIKPLIFDTARRGYHGVGPRLAQAFSAGKNLSRQSG
jgi:flavin reductase (DIM6/NTAB) family NADH-FMN oxidoreductase RutF